ncbi:HVA22-like protein a [Camellia lanceoleosa]|uniref:HVA22-like protein a n=1 Tax=Camellia lanceoleosa TaxID=1840588 RepID=A0ACC0IQP1_9ERIC|nr:HVA22-like protein a [Camellia lanceoleosa]
MGIVSFLKLGLKCFFDFLAWPLFALVCPLYASVWAIESNSNSDMRNLVAYWIVFSLISLFELAFVKLIEWLPFWPYMKLMAICWLGIPNFNGACYVYECLIRSCLSVNLQGVIERFIKHKDDLPLNAESFLAVAERYVKENGSEELEKLIDRSRHTKPNIDKEEIKAVTNTEEKETATAIQVKFLILLLKTMNFHGSVVKFQWVATREHGLFWYVEREQKRDTPHALKCGTIGTFKEPNVAKEDAKAVDPKEKILSDSTQWSKFEEPYVADRNAKAGELNKKNPTAATEQVNCVELNLIQTEKKTVAASEIIEKMVTKDVRENKVVEVPAAAAGGGENKVTEIPASENVQREWTACQLTTMCEKNFQSHLQGRKHKAEFPAEDKEIQVKFLNAAPQIHEFYVFLS